MTRYLSLAAVLIAMMHYGSPFLLRSRELAVHEETNRLRQLKLDLEARQISIDERNVVITFQVQPKPTPVPEPDRRNEARL